MEIHKYINDQNRALWTELKVLYQIELVYDPNEWSWKTDSDNELVKRIITPNRRIEISSFTHELLHVYIDHLGMSTSEDMLHSIYGGLSFNVLIKNGLFAKIHNFCSHKKMFPFYQKMGFPENEFVSYPAKLSFLSYLSLRSKLKTKQTIGITDYIGNVLALLNNMGESKETYNKKKLNKLKRLCPSLYSIIERFDALWISSENLDLTIPFKLFDADLNQWLDENKIKIDQ